MFDFEAAKGPPLICAVIVLIAIVVLGGISFGFQGAVQF
jgi:hypothetical protein